MTDPMSPFEETLAARLGAHLDSAVEAVDAAAVTAASAAEAERAQRVRPTGVRWTASPPVRWRPVAAVAAVLVVTLSVALLAGAPDRPSPSPGPTATAPVALPSIAVPSRAPEATPGPALRRLSSNGLLAWSSDGAINVMAADGSDHVVLGGLDGPDRDPTWSPDGRWLAFASNADDGTGRLGMMLEDGSDIRTLVESEGSVMDPVWSPDGAWIAYTTDGLPSDVSVVHLATLRTTEVASGWAHDWSPDSRQLVVTQGRLVAALAIAQIDEAARPLDPRGRPVGVPDWSPVDDVIVFARDDDQGGGLMSIRSDGTGLSVLTAPEDGRDWSAAFDPFGARVAFIRTGSQRGGDPNRGWVLALADGAVRQLHDGGGWVGPVWSPDGRLLIGETGRGGFDDHASWVIVDAATGATGHEWDPGPEASVPSWQPLPYAVTCGGIDDETCRSRAIGIAANALEQYPDRRILSVAITTPCGSYDLAFTDGTGIGAEIDCVRP